MTFEVSFDGVHHDSEGDEEGKTGSCRRQALEKQWKL
jgi:hypothetical protein